MGTALKIALTACVGLAVASAAFRKGRLRENLAIIGQYRLRHLAGSVLAIAAVAAASYGLWVASPVFHKNPVLWAVSALFGWGSGNGQANLVFSGVETWRWYAVVFLPVLALALPWLARTEEESYRRRTRNWLDGSLRSLRFGLSHLLMLIPLGASLALTLAGLFFTWQYFQGAADPRAAAIPDPDIRADVQRELGVRRSTLYHAAFNTTLVTALFITIIATW